MPVRASGQKSISSREDWSGSLQADWEPPRRRAMSAYIIVDIKVTDPGTYQGYTKLVPD